MILIRNDAIVLLRAFQTYRVISTFDNFRGFKHQIEPTKHLEILHSQSFITWFVEVFSSVYNQIKNINVIRVDQWRNGDTQGP